MTIAEMRIIVGLPDATDAEVVAAYAALIDDGIPASIPIIEPVTVEQARQQCRLDDNVEDDLIAQKIRSAREWVEDETGRAIAQQTRVAHFRSWGCFLELTTRPIVSIDAIAYNGSEGDGIYDDAAYAIGPNPLRIYPGSDGFPALRSGGGITVAYTAGYDAGEVPNSVVEAIQVLVAGMLSEREGAYDTSLAAASRLVRRLWIPAV